MIQTQISTLNCAMRWLSAANTEMLCDCGACTLVHWSVCTELSWLWPVFGRNAASCCPPRGRVEAATRWTDTSCARAAAPAASRTCLPKSPLTANRAHADPQSTLHMSHSWIGTARWRPNWIALWTWTSQEYHLLAVTAAEKHLQFNHSTFTHDMKLSFLLLLHS